MALSDKLRVWTTEATHIDSLQFDLIRRIQHLDESLWQPHLLGGHYQPTGLTTEVSHSREGFLLPFS